ncbi:hypothetical protein ABPG73_002419 [Tetrahymena malaccensis]
MLIVCQSKIAKQIAEDGELLDMLQTSYIGDPKSIAKIGQNFYINKYHLVVLVCYNHNMMYTYSFDYITCIRCCNKSIQVMLNQCINHNFLEVNSFCNHQDNLQGMYFEKSKSLFYKLNNYLVSFHYKFDMQNHKHRYTIIQTAAQVNPQTTGIQLVYSGVKVMIKELSNT